MPMPKINISNTFNMFFLSPQSPKCKIVVASLNAYSDKSLPAIVMPKIYISKTLKNAQI